MRPVFKKWTYVLYKIHMHGPGENLTITPTLSTRAITSQQWCFPYLRNTLGGFCASGTMELDLSKGLIVNSSSGQRFLLYGAFFTDCTHSVQEVTIGWRVVVQSDVCEEIDNVEKLDSDDDGLDYFEQVVYCLESDKSVLSTKIRIKEQTELMHAVLHYMMAKIPRTDGVAFFSPPPLSFAALIEVVLKGVDRNIYDTFSKRQDLSLCVPGVLVSHRLTEDGRDVRVSAVSMKDFVLCDEND